MKWAGFEDSHSTWEPASNIKPFIVHYYEGGLNKNAQFFIMFFAIPGDSSRLGGRLPKPTIKYSREAGEGEWVHYIEV